MSEIKKDVIHLDEGETYTADADGADVIPDDRTISDITRWIVENDWAGEVLELLKTDHGIKL